MTDLSKAFHCIDHELLIAKTHVYGFDIKSLKFIDGCLAGKKQGRINSSLSVFVCVCVCVCVQGRINSSLSVFVCVCVFRIESTHL